MEILVIILLLIVIVLLISNNIRSNQKFHNLENRITELKNLLKNREANFKTTEPAKEAVVKPAPVQQPAVNMPRPQDPPDEVKPVPVIERHPKVIADNLSQIRKPVMSGEPAKENDEEPVPSFFERYPDLEKFIGENLVNKIGIAILVLAIGFFVKYAIDNNWVGPVGRVGIGIICGGILIAIAHKLRNSYNAFSSVLAGGGLAIFYFSVTLAYQQFHLFDPPTALTILTVVTIFAVILSLLYNKQELAVIALIGGFASPFLVNNGSANYNGLFIYLVILNTGLLIIAYYKAWRVLNIFSFAFSVAVLATILFTVPASGYAIAFRYATVFYLLFFTINIINNIRENKKFLASDFSILLINTALYFSAGVYLLTVLGLGQFRGLFSAGLAALNLVLSFVLFRNKRADLNVIYLLIGITLTFISLTAPIQLHGNNITLFWATETVLLYWLYQKSGIKLMQLTSLIIWLAMLVSLLTDLFAVYTNTNLPLTIIANRGFVTAIFSAFSSYLLYILLIKDGASEIYGMGISKNLYRVTALILLFLSGLLEINHQFSYYFPGSGLNILYLMLYVPVFVVLLNFISTKVNASDANWQAGLCFLAATIGLYLVFTPAVFELIGVMLDKQKPDIVHLIARWISDGFIALIFYRLIITCREYFEDEIYGATLWIISAAVVLFLSLEFCLLSIWLFYAKDDPINIIEIVYVKTALPVLWGIISFILMWLGMRNKMRVLRIISLSLFTITLLKLFLFDINNIPVAGKIAAFFCLGILLLIISFMYQKVKKIIVNDGDKPKE